MSRGQQTNVDILADFGIRLHDFFLFFFRGKDFFTSMLSTSPKPLTTKKVLHTWANAI